MENIYWKKLTTFQKVIFCFGWLAVFNIGFWIIMIIYNNVTQEDNFWNPGSLRIVFIFGWIHFVIFLLSIPGIFL